MDKDNLKFHLNRIEGQIRGIGKMIDNKEDSIDVIRQVMAAKSSLERLAVKILKKESLICSKKRIDKVVDILFKIN